MEIRNILYPTDFSRGSDAAAAAAADLSQKYGARLHVLHIIYDISRDGPWFTPGADADEMYRDVKNGALDEIERVRAEHFPALENVATTVKVGSAFEDIIGYCKENSIDLIVMGTHGKTGLDRIIFGSTAQRVVRRAKCPVLTVREQT